MSDIVPLFTSKTMGFLDKLSSGASAASGIVGAVGGLGSLIFGNSRQKSMARYQQKLQMQLNEQQQQYARENAQTDYDRQRALVRDNASLEKAGRQAAGLSTAGDFGSGSASVSPISAPSAGSAPTMPDPNASMLAGIQTVQASANSLVQNRALELSNEHQELENAALREALPDYTQGIIGEGKSAAAKGEVDSASVDADRSKRSSESITAGNEAYTSEVNASYASTKAFAETQILLQNVLSAKALLRKAENEADLKGEELQLFRDSYQYSLDAAKQNAINLKKQGKAIDASANASNAAANASNAAAEDSREHAKVNKEQARSIRVSTRKVREEVRALRFTNDFNDLNTTLVHKVMRSELYKRKLSAHPTWREEVEANYHNWANLNAYEKFETKLGKILWQMRDFLEK